MILPSPLQVMVSCISKSHQPLRWKIPSPWTMILLLASPSDGILYKQKPLTLEIKWQAGSIVLKGSRRTKAQGAGFSEVRRTLIYIYFSSIFLLFFLLFFVFSIARLRLGQNLGELLGWKQLEKGVGRENRAKTASFWPVIFKIKRVKTTSFWTLHF